jgi:hypothetical protein
VAGKRRGTNREKIAWVIFVDEPLFQLGRSCLAQQCMDPFGCENCRIWKVPLFLLIFCSEDPAMDLEDGKFPSKYYTHPTFWVVEAIGYFKD